MVGILDSDGFCDGKFELGISDTEGDVEGMEVGAIDLVGSALSDGTVVGAGEGTGESVGITEGAGDGAVGKSDGTEVGAGEGWGDSVGVSSCNSLA